VVMSSRGKCRFPAVLTLSEPRFKTFVIMDHHHHLPRPLGVIHLLLHCHHLQRTRMDLCAPMHLLDDDLQRHWRHSIRSITARHSKGWQGTLTVIVMCSLFALLFSVHVGTHKRAKAKREEMAGALRSDRMKKA